jgi:hypothetical protein
LAEFLESGRTAQALSFPVLKPLSFREAQRRGICSSPLTR